MHFSVFIKCSTNFVRNLVYVLQIDLAATYFRNINHGNILISKTSHKTYFRSAITTCFEHFIMK